MIDNFRSPPFTRILLDLGFIEQRGIIKRRGDPSIWRSPGNFIGLSITNEQLVLRYRPDKYEFHVSEWEMFVSTARELFVQEVLDM